MSKLFLLRHIKSQWNEENRFTGWMDVPLDKHEIKEAENLAEKISKLEINKVYSSSLFRNQDTLARVLQCIDDKYPVFVHLDKGRMQKWGNYIDISENDISVYISENLNERYYGKLQGESKEEAAKKYGEEQIHLWRRSYNMAPPGGESLKDVFRRTIPFYKKYVEKDLRGQKNVLLVASHNALRSIVKYIEKIPDEKIIDLEIPYACLTEYDLGLGLEIKGKKVL